MDVATRKSEDVLRNVTIQHYFLRLSSLDKMDFLTKMLLKLTSLYSISIILNTFFSVNTKLMNYTKIMIESNLIYNQHLFDHNRMLNKEVLDATRNFDLEWFEILNDEDQIAMMIDLLRLSGGDIINKMYLRIIRHFKQRVHHDLETNQYKNYRSDPNINFTRLSDRLIKFPDFVPQQSEEEDNLHYDQSLEISKKVNEGRKEWQTQMDKMKKEVKGLLKVQNKLALRAIKKRQKAEKERKKKEKERKKKEKESAKGSDKSKKKGSKKGSSKKKKEGSKKGSSKKKKKGSSKGSSKKKKKGSSKGKKKKGGKKGGKKRGGTDVDWIQVLPIWIVKKIFTYLDEKTLRTIKKVNKYWTNIIKDITADRKMRRKLDNLISKSEKRLSTLLEQQRPPDLEKIDDMPIESKFKPKPAPCPVMGREVRMKKLSMRGATLPKLVKDNKPLREFCVLTDSFVTMHPDKTPTLRRLKAFPVNVPDLGNEPLYPKLEKVEEETIGEEEDLDRLPFINIEGLMPTPENLSKISLIPSINLTNMELKRSW